MKSLREQMERIEDVLRTNGEARSLLLMSFFAVAIWIGGWWLFGMASEEAFRLATQEERFSKFLEVVRMYREATTKGEAAVAVTPTGDALTVLTGVVGKLNLGGKKPEYATSGKAVSFRIDGLYAEELLTLLQEIEGAGLRVGSAELKTLPDKNGKLFSVSLMLEGNA